jgi:AcrR family transcriptional regulator
MLAIAAEAGVSRPTLYAHHGTLAEVLQAAVERAVRSSLGAIEAARPGDGPADEALDRLIAASWHRIARFDALARGAAEHISAGALHRAHAPLMTPLAALVERGRRDGVFRTDLPADWLVTTYIALVHAADEHARTHSLKRDAALDMLTTTIHDLFAPRPT